MKRQIETRQMNDALSPRAQVGKQDEGVGAGSRANL